jgi:hypothetical protein
VSQRYGIGFGAVYLNLNSSRTDFERAIIKNKKTAFKFLKHFSRKQKSASVIMPYPWDMSYISTYAICVPK